MILLLLTVLSFAADRAPSLEESPQEAASIGAEALQNACDAGGAVSCHRLARRYHAGTGGVSVDPLRAASLYEKACDGGVLGDCSFAAWSYMQNRPDPARAAHYATRGCEAGDVRACFVLGHLQIVGAGVERDMAKGLERVEAACTAGVGEACSTLGMVYAGGIQDHPPDHEKARPLLERACASDDVGACGWLGYVLLAGADGPTDGPRGVELLTRACEAGDPGACENLAAAWIQGIGTEASKERAAHYLERACAGGMPASCAQLAGMTMQGVGRPADREAGLRIAKRACELGESSTCRELDVMCRVGNKAACR